MTASASPAALDDGKIVCQIDGARVHAIQLHIKNHHPDWTIDRYKAEYPNEPLLSAFAKSQLVKRQAEKDAADRVITTAEVVSLHGNAAPTQMTVTQQPMHELFGMGRAKAALAANGNPIMIDVYSGHDEEAQTYLADIDPAYVFDIETTKAVILGQALNIATYFWGMHGTGKTSAFEQFHARTGRPFMRVQHTADTESAHILGMWTVKDGETVFQLGPLPLAMLNGYTYCADEYDFAMPSITAVYQPVMEGKNLVIKEAPPEMRVIRPHPNFRFVATGNTNGAGDETGLYQGTQIQNAANYSRFGIVKEIEYMPAKMETAIVAAQAQIDLADAGNLVQIAIEIRDAFKNQRVSTTISTRELIRIAQIGLARRDWMIGYGYGFINRLDRVSKEVVTQYASRVLGKAA